MEEIESIDKLISICDRLLGPEGCPWDREQTMQSARTYVLEEVCELIEAIDLNDNSHIEEELGDLFFNAIFLNRLAEKEGRCRLAHVVQGITEKLIRRHPHVFGDVVLEDADAVKRQWDRIKKSENGKEHRKSILDGIPKGLPALSRAYKISKKIGNPSNSIISSDFNDEESLGNLLWAVVEGAVAKKIDPENALRKVLALKEKEFRSQEPRLL